MKRNNKRKQKGNRKMKKQKFDSRLTPIRFAERRKGHAFWLYQCICGTRKIIQQSSVNRGLSRSCGCLKKEITVRRNIEQKGFQNKNKSNKGLTPANKGKIRIHKIPNDPSSPFRYVTEQELTKIYWGVTDEGF